MPTRAAETQVDETPGVGTAAKQVAEHASTLARLELELAGLELKQKAGALGAGVGLGSRRRGRRALRHRLPVCDRRRRARDRSSTPGSRS